MKLENQVCTFEQAKRLKELGVKQESIWFWEEMRHPVPQGCATKRLQLYADVGHAISRSAVEANYSAFSATELGAMIPCNPSSSVNYSYYHRYNWRGHSIGYTALGLLPIEREWFKIEVEARADLLIHLLENSTIVAEEVNQRLSA